MAGLAGCMAGWLGWLAGWQPARLPGCLAAWLTATWLPDWGRVAARRRRELSAARPPPQRKLRTHPPPNALVFLRLEVYELRGSGFMLVISPDMCLGYFMDFMWVCVCVFLFECWCCWVLIWVRVCFQLRLVSGFGTSWNKHQITGHKHEHSMKWTWAQHVNNMKSTRSKHDIHVKTTWFVHGGADLPKKRPLARAQKKKTIVNN